VVLKGIRLIPQAAEVKPYLPFWGKNPKLLLDNSNAGFQPSMRGPAENDFFADALRLAPRHCWGSFFQGRDSA
jgi:hypothetical protein